MNFDMASDWDFLEELKEVDIVQELEVAFKKLIKKVRYNAKQLRIALGKELSGAFKDTAKMIVDAFQVESLQDQENAAAIYGRELASSLYVLQGSLTRLKAALISVAAPFVQVLVPAIRLAVDTVTNLANSIGYVLRMLFFGAEEADSFSQSLGAVSAAGTAAKKTLAGFDQINRLGSNTGSGGGFFSQAEMKPLTGIWKTLADRLTQLVAPLKEIDLTPAAQSLAALKKAVEPLTKALFSGLEWAWTNLFVPLAQWTVEELLPVFLDTLTVALEALATVIQELKPYFSWLWENFLKPLAQWAGDQVIAYLQGIAAELQGFSGWIGINQGPVETIVSTVKDFIGSIAQAAEKTQRWGSVSQQTKGALDQMLTSIISGVPIFDSTGSAIGLLGNAISGLADSFGFVGTASGTAWEGLKQIWGNAWSWLKSNTVDPTFSGVKSSMNGMIGMFNGVLSGITSGVNGISGMMNKLRITIPDWVPLFGGKSISFNLQSFAAPKVPYLARGAVLPANKPFMAVVGDQRHGTNVEAPLATIQEAVAAVMEDQVAAMMAGFQALLHENRLLRSTVEGIELGDSTIGSAAERYYHKMHMMRGGF